MTLGTHARRIMIETFYVAVARVALQIVRARDERRTHNNLYESIY